MPPRSSRRVLRARAGLVTVRRQSQAPVWAAAWVARLPDMLRVEADTRHTENRPSGRKADRGGGEFSMSDNAC